MSDERIQVLFEKFAQGYISVLGQEKWDSLTLQEQHDAIMIILNDLNRMI